MLGFINLFPGQGEKHKKRFLETNSKDYSSLDKPEQIESKIEGYKKLAEFFQILDGSLNFEPMWKGYLRKVRAGQITFKNIPTEKNPGKKEITFQGIEGKELKETKYSVNAIKTSFKEGCVYEVNKTPFKRIVPNYYLLYKRFKGLKKEVPEDVWEDLKNLKFSGSSPITRTLRSFLNLKFFASKERLKKLALRELWQQAKKDGLRQLLDGRIVQLEALKKRREEVVWTE